MSYEKDPHVREREIAYYFGGVRIPLKDRPSKHSGMIDHPWMDIYVSRNTRLRRKMAKYLLAPYSMIKTPDKLHVHVFTGSGSRMADSIMLLRTGDFMQWFGGSCDWREHWANLERERIEREAEHEYTEFNAWSIFPDI